MKKIEHTYSDSKEILVHYDGPFDSYALCGMDTCGDNIDGIFWDAAVPSTKRVNCPQCIAIRDHVKGKK